MTSCSPSSLRANTSNEHRRWHGQRWWETLADDQPSCEGGTQVATPHFRLTDPLGGQRRLGRLEHPQKRRESCPGSPLGFRKRVAGLQGLFPSRPRIGNCLAPICPARLQGLYEVQYALLGLRAVCRSPEVGQHNGSWRTCRWWPFQRGTIMVKHGLYLGRAWTCEDQ